MTNEFIELLGLGSAWDDAKIVDPYPYKTAQIKEALRKAREEHFIFFVFDREAYELQRKLRGELW